MHLDSLSDGSADVTDTRSQMQLAVSVGAIGVRNARVGLVGRATSPKTDDPKGDVGFDPVSDMFVPGLIG